MTNNYDDGSAPWSPYDNATPTASASPYVQTALAGQVAQSMGNAAQSMRAGQTSSQAAGAISQPATVQSLQTAAATRTEPRTAAETSVENPWQVSRVASAFHSAVTRWPPLWVEGQISEINTRRAGSAYLTIRDNTTDVTMQALAFGDPARAAAQFRQGDRVVMHGRADLWQKATRLSFKFDDIRRIGEGDLKAQIEELRKKLKGEGLFDEENKVPLPEFPRHIGLICAPRARAEGDVMTNAHLRWPTVEFTVVYAHVQGPECPPEVVKAIRQLDADPDVDVIIVARGGGSFEDLLGFSDESVVRATAACVTPIVSAIGHEDDWTLIDLAADLRASTPTDAAKRVVPDVMEQLQIVAQARQRIGMRMSAYVNQQIQLVEGYANRPSLTNPITMLDRPQRFLDEGRQRLDIAVRRLIDEETLTVEKTRSSLRALSPQATLNRGFAVVQTADGHVVRDCRDVAAGDELRIAVQAGIIDAQVRGTVAPEAN